MPPPGPPSTGADDAGPEDVPSPPDTIPDSSPMVPKKLDSVFDRASSASALIMPPPADMAAVLANQKRFSVAFLGPCMSSIL